MRNAKIIGADSYAPEKIITAADIDGIFGEGTSKKLYDFVGMRDRHQMAEDESSSDLAVKAALKLLQKEKIKPEELDLIIVATDTPDNITPHTSATVQYKLGAKNAAVFDINSACASWLNAIDVASKMIAVDDAYKKVLVVGVYAMSKYLNWSDGATAPFFADGAGAVLIAASSETGFLGSKFIADGQYVDYLGVFAGGTRQPVTKETQAPQYLVSKKKYPVDINTSRWPGLVKDLMKKIGKSVTDIDKLYFTQININYITETMQELGLPMDKTFTIMDRYGYTGSACMPMALADSIKEDKGPQKGDLVVFCGGGAGFSMGAVAFIW